MKFRLSVPRTLGTRITIAAAVLTALIVTAVSIFVLSDARERAFSNLEARAAQHARALAGAIDAAEQTGDSQDALTRRIAEVVGAHVTLFGPDGGVLLDSPPGSVSTADLTARAAAFAAADSPATSAQRPREDQGGAYLYAGARSARGRVVTVGLPVADVDSLLRNMRQNAVISSLLVVVSATMVAGFLARRLTRSIRVVTEGARKVASGDLEHRLKPEPPLEVEQLATAVNEMAGELLQLIAKEASERERLSSILATMTDGVLVVDEEGIVELANPAALEMIDAEKPFAPGERLVALSRNYELNQAAVNTAATGSGRQTQIDLLDSGRFLRVLAVPLVLPADDPARRALVLLHDLTEQRRVETTRREFVSNASHELRTPIASIAASVETLEGGAIDDPAACREFLRMIREDAGRMEAMVRELLELSRLQSGQTPLHMAPLEPRAVAERAVQRFQHRARRAGVSLRLDLEENLPVITGDPDKLDQVMANLLTNAFAATPSGGTVEVRARRAGGELEILVRDNGRGIETAHLPHVFERFFKADPSRQDGGAGLGLAIAKHIVQIHSGSISVESRVGEGSTFTIRFPLALGFEAQP